MTVGKGSLHHQPRAHALCKKQVIYELNNIQCNIFQPFDIGTSQYACSEKAVFYIYKSEDGKIAEYCTHGKSLLKIYLKGFNK